MKGPEVLFKSRTSCLKSSCFGEIVWDSPAVQSFCNEVVITYSGEGELNCHGSRSPATIEWEGTVGSKSFDEKDTGARTIRYLSFEGLICPRGSDHALNYLQRSRFVTLQHNVRQIKLSQVSLGAGRDMEELEEEITGKTDSQNISQQETSPFREPANLSAVQTRSPPQSGATKLQRPLHKVHAREHLQSSYVAGASMGQSFRGQSSIGPPSLREKYELRDLTLSSRSDGVSDPFGTPLSKSAINTFQASLQSVRMHL